MSEDKNLGYHEFTVSEKELKEYQEQKKKDQLAFQKFINEVELENTREV